LRLDLGVASRYSMGVRIAVRQGSLTDGDETLLVNASNTNVTLGTGVSGAIRRACGAGYQEHIARALAREHGGPMAPGDVLVTDAGRHPRARWVAHCAVMDYRQGFGARSYPTPDVIRACCTNLLGAIERLPAPVTVAMVALGAGTGQLGVRIPTQIACDALKAHAQACGDRSRMTGCTFYGFELFEFAAIADVVSGVYPEVLGTISPEARALFERG
jgi:O-acetyl-ADP-ribose deacetylase (regulator of RNase III)